MRLGVPGTVLLCRRPFVEPPGWGLQSSCGGTRTLPAALLHRPPIAACGRIAAIAHENPASV
ncbi:hypothetical protein DID96_00670 [Burkholderia sp. Bp8963]|nr:hypothetical protein DID96_00670 [Burkholderia sp. Bp8963]